MSLNIARFPLIGVETENPTREHYRCEAARLRAHALHLFNARAYGGASKAHIEAEALAARFEKIALRLPEQKRSAA